MSKPGRPSQEKRARERAKKEKNEEKRADRAVRKEERKTRIDGLEAGVDPDLVGIYPGPQPPQEY